MQVTPLVGGPSANSFEGEANKFAQNHVVTLPSKQCDNCYLRCEQWVLNINTVMNIRRSPLTTYALC